MEWNPGSERVNLVHSTSFHLGEYMETSKLLVDNLDNPSWEVTCDGLVSVHRESRNTDSCFVLQKLEMR